MARRFIMQTFIQDIEKLKKEVWALSKKTSALQSQVENLNSADVEEFLLTVQNHQNVLDELSLKISNLEATVKTHGTKITSLEENSTSFQASIDELTSSLQEISNTTTELSNSLSTLSQTVSSHTQTLQTHETSISNVQTKAQTNETNIASIQTDLDQLKTKVTATTATANLNKSNIDALEDEDDHLQTQITLNKTDIATLNTAHQTTATTANQAYALAQELKTTVEGLQTSGEGGSGSTAGLNGVVLYDMRSEDENVNKGYTTGIPTKTKVYFSALSTYRFLKIYCILNGSYESQLIIDLQNRKGTSFTAIAWVSIYYLSFLRVKIPTSNEYISFDGFARFIFDGTTPIYSMNPENITSHYYIFRIEGIV